MKQGTTAAPLTLANLEVAVNDAAGTPKNGAKTLRLVPASMSGRTNHLILPTRARSPAYPGVESNRIVAAPATVCDHVRHDIVLRPIDDRHGLLESHEPPGQLRRMQMCATEQHPAPCTKGVTKMFQPLDRTFAMLTGILSPPGHRDFWTPIPTDSKQCSATALRSSGL